EAGRTFGRIGPALLTDGTGGTLPGREGLGIATLSLQEDRLALMVEALQPSTAAGPAQDGLSHLEPERRLVEGVLRGEHPGQPERRARTDPVGAAAVGSEDRPREGLQALSAHAGACLEEPAIEQGLGGEGGVIQWLDRLPQLLGGLLPVARQPRSAERLELGQRILRLADGIAALGLRGQGDRGAQGL